MAKLSTVGIGKFIRSIRGGHGSSSQNSNIEIWYVKTNDGNQFICYPVLDPKPNPPVLDYSHHYFLTKDQEVEQVTP